MVRSTFGPFSSALVSALLLGGCTVVKVGEGGVSRTLIGIVRVELPQTTGNLTAIETRSLGVGADEGLILGYRGSSLVTAPPDSCQITVIIRSGTEAAQAASVLKQLKGDRICTADFSAPSPPASR